MERRWGKRRRLGQSVLKGAHTEACELLPIRLCGYRAEGLCYVGDCGVLSRGLFDGGREACDGQAPLALCSHHGLHPFRAGGRKKCDWDAVAVWWRSFLCRCGLELAAAWDAFSGPGDGAQLRGGGLRERVGRKTNGGPVRA